MVWSKLIHFWDIRWLLPLFPIYFLGWMLAIPGLCIVCGSIISICKCEAEKKTFFMIPLGIAMTLPFIFVILLNANEERARFTVTLVVLIILLGLILLAFVLISCRIQKTVMWWNQELLQQMTRVYDPEKGEYVSPLNINN